MTDQNKDKIVNISIALNLPED